MNIWILFILMLVISGIIINKGQQIYMKMIGASGMFFNGKKKIIAIIILAFILIAIVIYIFGIEIPV